MLAAPPSEVRSVGVLWHEQATVDPALQQRLIEAITEALEIDPAGVIPDAIPRARRLVAYQLQPERIEELGRLHRRLRDATFRFRAGELMPAWDQAAGVLEGLRADPLLPGAATLAWRAHLLRAQVSWTQADQGTTDAELRAAIALDPAARLTTRRVPPDFADRYEAQRTAILGDPGSWETPRVDAGGDARIEIDGEPGLRSVPPGEHFVVVRRLGAQPWGVVMAADGTVNVPRAETVIATGLPRHRKEAQLFCDRLETDVLVLARQRDERLGLQAFDCGDGYADPWFSLPTPEPEAVQDGVRLALGLSARGATFDEGIARVASREPWPEPEPELGLTPEGTQPGDRGTDKPKPWYKRAWVWVIVGAVVVGGVTTGAVLGTRDADQVYKVGDGFLR